MNPYLEKFSDMPDDHSAFIPDYWGQRRELVVQYSWAIPNAQAINYIATLSPIVEMGAGTGYWASLIAAAGADIVAYDSAPPDIKENSYRHKEVYFPVKEGFPEMLEAHSDRTLLLCWPPYKTSMAENALRHWKGKNLIYIGEDECGCTGDVEFHVELNRSFERLVRIQIPTWDGIHDELHHFRRRAIQ